MFKRILLAGGLGGILAGLLLSLVQSFQVVPIIVEAESYESAAVPSSLAAELPASEAHDHDHASGGWSPAHGLERTFWTAIANVGTAVGFGLMLAAAFALRDRVTLTQGMLWGAAGFAVFFIAPSLGLPPEIPGAESAALDGRQLWWTLTVICSGLGLGFLVFGPQWGLRVAGAVILLVPHLVGAPQPDVHGGLAPESLAEQFVVASSISNGIFWVTLGVVTAFLFRRLH